MIKIRLFSTVMVLFAALVSDYCYAQNNTVYLTQEFIEKYKNLALITTPFDIHHAHDRPNQVGTGSNDGDLHAAGIPNNEVGLPTVVEIMNAHQDDAASPMLEEGTKATVTGVWRPGVE